MHFNKLTFRHRGKIFSESVLQSIDLDHLQSRASSSRTEYNFQDIS